MVLQIFVLVHINHQRVYSACS